MKKYLSLVAGAMLMTACSNDAEVSGDNQSSGQEIAVTVAQESLTRAQGEIDASVLQTAGFGLFASYTERLTYENTSVSPDFMYNQKVVSTDNGETWVYNPVKYWPNSTDYETGTIYNEYLTFFAYAPYEASPKDDGRCIIGMSGRYDKGDPWVNYRLVDDPWAEEPTFKQVDLLYGVKQINATGGDDLFYNETKPAFNEKLKIYFRHALACIGDKITIRLADDFKSYISDYADISISKVEIVYNELTTKARLNLNSPTGPNWKELVSGELTTTRTYTKTFDPAINLIVNNPYEISANEGLFYIPLRIKGCDAPYAEVTVDYTIKPKNSITESEYSGSVSTRFDLDLTLEGKKQGIELILTKDLDLLHLTYDITDEQAQEPSYSRQWK